jgi:hypothetical protein
MRIQQNDQIRRALWQLTYTLRDSACVIHSNDLNRDGIPDSTPQGVNFKLNNGDGSPLVRDGLLVYLDSAQTTIYHDGDDVGHAGHGYPDVVGFDDADGDGHADVLGIGLVAQDDNQDGQQDFIDIDRDGTADDVAKDEFGNTDGEPDMLWKLVIVRFNNIGDVTQTALWKNGKALARNIDPIVRDLGGVTENYDTLSYGGCCLHSYDYGKDGVFETSDTGEGDSTIKEYEIAISDPLGASTGVIDTAAEIAVIGTVRLNLRIVTRYEKGRVDVDCIRTSVAPRALSIVHRLSLLFPVPG